MRVSRLGLLRKCAFGGLVASGLSLSATTVLAAPIVTPGYSLSVFAAPLAGSSAPDSIAVAGGDVFVGYGNGGAPDGSGGAMSTIAEYSRTGTLLGQTTVVGHNDGLRYNAQSGQLWALQNEDGNPNLVLINPATLAQSTPLSFSSTPHGGGYDDIAFGRGATYISASNPQSNPNTAPAIDSISLGVGQVNVLGGVLAGNATAQVINGGGVTTLNLQDPDSMIFTPNGQLMLDSQADQQLVFVSHVGASNQAVSVLNLPTTVDDTVFTGRAGQTLLFADRGSGIVYALTGPLGSGQAYSAADSLNQIALLDLTTGQLTPVVSGLNGPHGEALLSGVPEPATWVMMLAGVGIVGAGLRMSRRRPITSLA